MKFSQILKSPIFSKDHHWDVKKRRAYESDVTALVRAMVQDESIREDQRFAWERWRAEDRLPGK